MKRILFASAALALALLTGAAWSACAYTGEAGPPMLKLVYGSRALSLGGAYTGVANDVYYMDSNPAGGDPSRVFKVSFIHQEWIADANYEAVRFSRGFSNRFFVGFGFTYLYLPFTYYDDYGYASGDYTISQCMGTLNAGYVFEKYNIAVGGNLKAFYNSVPQDLYPGQSYLLFAGDVGVIARTNLFKTYIGPEPSLSVGVTVKNLGYSQVMQKLPTEVHVGASYRVIRNLLVSGEAVVPLYEPIYGSVGVEFDVAKTFFLQGGVQITENPMAGVGFGYRRKDFNIYASYTPSLAFRNMMSVSVEFTIGSTKGAEREKEIHRLMVEALDAFRDAEYGKAKDLADKVLELDPVNRKAKLLKKVIEDERNINGKSGKGDSVVGGNAGNSGGGAAEGTGTVTGSAG
jgi:Uncharacterised protein family (UPF0164)